MRSLFISLFSVLLALGTQAGSDGLAAQSTSEGRLSVQVVDESGRTLSGVLVTILRDGQEEVSRRGEAGRALLFVGLRPGSRSVRAEALGFRPALVLDAEVVGGETTPVTVQLNAGTPPFDRVDSTTAPAAPASFLGGTHLRASDIRAPDPSRSLGQSVGRFDQELGTEGLPGTLTRSYVEGVPVGSTTQVGIPRRVAPELPRLALSSATLTAGGSAPFSGAMSGIVVQSLDDGRQPRVSFGWAPAPAVSGVSEVDGLGQGFSAEGGGGTVLENDISLAGFFDVLMQETPAAPLIREAESGALASLIPPDDAGRLGAPAPRRWERIRAAGRVEAPLDPAVLTVSGGIHSSRAGTSGLGLARHLYGLEGVQDGMAFWFNAGLRTALGDNGAFDLRLGVDRDETSDEWGSDASDGAFALTHLASGSAFGLSGDLFHPGRSTGIYVSPQFQVQGDGIALRLGLQGETRRHSFDNQQGERGAFSYTDVAAMSSGGGTFIGHGSVEAQEFRTDQTGIFAEFRADAGQRGEIRLGGRADYTQLPFDDYRPDSVMIRRTGLVPPTDGDILSVGGVAQIRLPVDASGSSWMSGLVSVGTGVPDAQVLNTLFSLQNGQTVRRNVGGVTGWPSPPLAGLARNQYAVLGADYRLPRTIRGEVAVDRRSGAWWGELRGFMRRSDFLIRPRDLNRSQSSVASSSQQSLVYGDLLKLGGVLVADPASNRRLPEFDRIWALDPDGWSTYVGATASVEYRESRGSLRLSYTRSSTTDNWFGARSPSLDARLPWTDVADFDDERSDFDVPDRLRAFGRFALLPHQGISAHADFRWRSDYPFSAGYPATVDANGDGSALNDIARVADVGALSGDWACLDQPAGTVVGRNTCRGPSIQELDVGLSMNLPGSRGLSARVDLLNILASDWGLRDQALYRADPALPGTDAFILNPSFGEILVPLTSPTMVRVQLRYGF